MKHLSSAFFLIALISFPLSGRYHSMRGKRKFERLIYLIDESKSPREVKKILARSSFSKQELATATKQARKVLVIRKKQLPAQSDITAGTSPTLTTSVSMSTSILRILMFPAYLLLSGCAHFYQSFLLPILGMLPFGARLMRSPPIHSRSANKKAMITYTNKKLENAQKITELLMHQKTL